MKIDNNILRQIISDSLGCNETEITNISEVKKGMTNSSFSFRIERNNETKKYIIRIPGEGTEYLINRRNEANVYKTIKGLGFCDDPVYINPDNGIKISKFLEGTRTCDGDNETDLTKCMSELRRLHSLGLEVPHTFDLFERIDFYERLRGGTPSRYPDYQITKENIITLQRYLDKQKKEWCLSHIDSVCDNYLFVKQGDGNDTIHLTDWEYAGMQDPHVDIAMFCLYSLYTKEQCDRLIDIYFEGHCDYRTRIKIYAYIAIGGLLWSNWCEYKRIVGIDLGHYAEAQYNYAKEFFQLVKES